LAAKLPENGLILVDMGFFSVTVQGVIKKMSYMELDGITMNKQL
jgi:hypothetical protein